MTCQVPDGLLRGVRRLLQSFPVGFEGFHVHEDAPVFHLRKNAAEGHLHVAEQGCLPPLLQPRLHHRAQAPDPGRIREEPLVLPGRLQSELPVLGLSAAGRDAAPAVPQAREAVVAGRGIQKISSQRRVELPAAGLNAREEAGAHELLHLVAGLPHLAAKNRTEGRFVIRRSLPGEEIVRFLQRRRESGKAFRHCNGRPRSLPEQIQHPGGIRDALPLPGIDGHGIPGRRLSRRRETVALDHLRELQGGEEPVKCVVVRLPPEVCLRSELEGDIPADGGEPVGELRGFPAVLQFFLHRIADRDLREILI